MTMLAGSSSQFLSRPRRKYFFRLVAAALFLSSCTPPLIVKAQKGDLAAIRALLAKHPDQATKDEALINAVVAGHLDAAALLMDSGADSDAKNEFGSTALTVCVARNDPAGVRFFLDRMVNMGRAVNALNNAPPAIAQIFVDHGFDPNLLEPDGSTPLSHAACSGQTDIVKFWLAHGADPNKAGKACERSHFDVDAVAVVCDVAATPLECAKAKGYSEITALLEAAVKR